MPRKVQRKHLGLTLVTAIVAVALALAMSACGSSGSPRSGGGITILETSFPDYLDPALSYTANGWQALLQVYPGLLTFAHASGRAGAQVKPALARALPQISRDGKTYRLRLREHLNFSNGQPVKASDFKASIERVFATGSKGVGLGYSDIVGAEQFQKAKHGGISGIVVDDASGAITIHLLKPRGAFTYELALPFAGVVPASTPVANQSQHPPRGAGRYVIANVRQDRGFGLAKNQRFSPGLQGTAVDVGRLAHINVKIVSNPSAQVTEIAGGGADFAVDNPPADRVGEVRAMYGGKRYREFATTSIFYIYMNASAPPFNQPGVRRAINYALDFNALNRLQAGFLAPAHQILPRQLPGYQPSPNLYPGPDLSRARALLRQAGVVGQKVTVWGDSQSPTRESAAYYADLLHKLGFRTTIKLVAPPAYPATIGDRSLKAQTGLANWTADYPHPADFIDALLNPDRVAATNNINYSHNSFDRAFAQRINTLTAQQLTPETEREWAALDAYAQQQAYWAPYATRKQSTFFSSRMDFQRCKGDDWPVGAHDWARFCLK